MRWRAFAALWLAGVLLSGCALPPKERTGRSEAVYQMEQELPREQPHPAPPEPEGEPDESSMPLPTEEDWNERLLQGILDHEASIPLPSVDLPDLDLALQRLLDVHPEIFWVSNGTVTTRKRAGVLVEQTFTPEYTYSREERDRLQTLIDRSAAVCLAGIPSDASDYEKVKHVYEYIVTNTEYRLDARDGQTICSVLAYGESVCNGYAKATQYLLGLLDVPCELVSGVVKGGEPHAWNLVWIDGESYYVDTTWGDPVPEPGQERRLEISYDYLGLTTKDLFLTHRPDDGAALPLCTATRWNYYVAEGRMLDGYDDECLAVLAQIDLDTGAQATSVKFADQESFEDALWMLFEQQEIFTILDEVFGEAQEARTVTYTRNEELHTLTIYWED